MKRYLRIEHQDDDKKLLDSVREQAGLHRDWLVTVLAATLLATAALRANNALATKYESKSQAISQINDCHWQWWLSIECWMSASQIQGDENSVAPASAQVSGDVEQ